MLFKSKFKKISLRGCAAYAICCLENALIHFDLKGDAWNFLLEKLWLFTSLPELARPQSNASDSKDMRDLEDLYGFYYECDPLNIILEAEERKSPSLRGLATIAEAEMYTLYDAYKSNDAVCNIIYAVCLIPYAGWNGGPDPVYPKIKALHKQMKKYGIGLPEAERFKKYGWLSKEKAALSVNGAQYGEPFNGKEERSIILNRK